MSSGDCELMKRLHPHPHVLDLPIGSCTQHPFYRDAMRCSLFVDYQRTCSDSEPSLPGSVLLHHTSHSKKELLFCFWSGEMSPNPWLCLSHCRRERERERQTDRQTDAHTHTSVCNEMNCSNAFILRKYHNHLMCTFDHNL